MAYSIKGFRETSFSDWPGRVAAVIFLPSCNFRCPFCHNRDLVLRPATFPDYPWEAIRAVLHKNRGWIDGVCITGGEPTLHPWLAPLIREIRSMRGLAPSGGPLAVKLDTNGSRPRVLESLIAEGLLDFVAMDLKGPLRADRYSALAGVAAGPDLVRRIRASIAALLRAGIDHQFRTTVVPALIREEEVYGLAREVRGARRYTLQGFNPRETLDERLRGAPPPDPAALRRMQAGVDEILFQEDPGCKPGARRVRIGVGDTAAGAPAEEKPFPLRAPNP